MKRTFSFRIEEDLMDKLSSKSLQQQVSISEIIIRCIEKYFGVIHKEVNNNSSKDLLKQVQSMEKKISNLEEWKNTIESKFD